MASTYSEYLRLELIGTGEQTGTWGDTTNTNLGTLLDQAVAGTATIDVTLGDVTLTTLNGASDQSRQAILRITGTPIATRNVIAPEQSKWYLISNECGQTVTIKGASTTGYAVADGATLLVFWDGTDFAAGSSTALGYTPVNKAGDTMTGNLILNAAPSTTLGAATKGYVDDAVSGAVGGNFVLKTGDTMTGPLVLSGAPSTSLQAATKGYVDSSISGAGYATQSWVTSQNYATTSTQSLLYYYTKTDADSRYVSVNTQALTYYPLTTTVAATYGAKASSNSWTGTNSFSVGSGTTFTVSGTGNTLTVNGNSISSTGTAYVNGSTGTFAVGSSGATLNVPTSLTFSTSASNSPMLEVNGYYPGDTASGAVIKMSNPGAGSTVRNKWLRVDDSGSLNVVNSAYSAALMQLSNTGASIWASNLTLAAGTGYKNGGGSWDAPSDARLKDNVQPLTGALDKIVQLNPVTYSWKCESAEPTVGFIAQEVSKVMPTAISEIDPTEAQKQFVADDKVLNVGWKNDMTAYLVGAIKELKAEVDALKAAK